MSKLAKLTSAAWFCTGTVLAAIAVARVHAYATEQYQGTPDDYMQINQLFSRYNYTIDNGDGVAWARNFTPDGVFQDPAYCAVGTDQLIAVVGRKPRLGQDQLEHHVHSLGPIMYASRDRATAHSTVMVVAETGFGKQGGIIITGTYDDTLVRANGQWLFKYRLVHRPADKPAVKCAAHSEYNTSPNAQ